jgi:hypothetical protein
LEVSIQLENVGFINNGFKLVSTATQVQKNKYTKNANNEYTTFGNKVRSTVPTFSTKEGLQVPTPFSYFKFRVYRVQLVLKMYGLDYNLTSKQSCIGTQEW